MSQASLPQGDQPYRQGKAQLTSQEEELPRNLWWTALF